MNKTKEELAREWSETCGHYSSNKFYTEYEVKAFLAGYEAAPKGKITEIENCIVLDGADINGPVLHDLAIMPIETYERLKAEAPKRAK